MAQLVILGGPGDGAIVAEAALAALRAGAPYALGGFLNDDIVQGETIHGWPVRGRLEDWSKLPGDTLFVPALHKVGAMHARSKRIEGLGIPKDRWGSVCHPHACIASDAAIGCGVFIAPFVTIQPGARIGDFVSIRPAAHVSHDTSVGSFAYIGSNATISGRSTIGEGVHIGPNAVIRERLPVGDYAVIGIGAVVTKPVEAHSVVYGNPARSHESKLESKK